MLGGKKSHLYVPTRKALKEQVARRTLLCATGVEPRIQWKYVCVSVLLFANPWSIAHQAPLSMEFPRQEYWRELLCPAAAATKAARPSGGFPTGSLAAASLARRPGQIKRGTQAPCGWAAKPGVLSKGLRKLGLGTDSSCDPL